MLPSVLAISDVVPTPSGATCHVRGLKAWGAVIVSEYAEGLPLRSQTINAFSSQLADRHVEDEPYDEAIEIRLQLGIELTPLCHTILAMIAPLRRNSLLAPRTCELPMGASRQTVQHQKCLPDFAGPDVGKHLAPQTSASQVNREQRSSLCAGLRL